MLAKTNRLKKEGDFKKILRNGKLFKGETLTLRIAQNDLAKVRAGISVSKKISKKATLRNKQKRRLASLLRAEMPKIKTGLDLFLVARPGLQDKSFQETKKICQDLFIKANIFKNDKKNYTENN
jgi:ribonuclease P protein component